MRATVAQQFSGQCAMRIDAIPVVLPQQFAIDDYRIDTRRTGNETIRTTGEIPHTPERFITDRVRVENNDIGSEPGFEASAIRNPEHCGRPRGYHAHGLAERYELLFAHPAAKQIRRQTRIAQLTRVRAGIGQSEHRRLACQQRSHLILLVIRNRHAKARLQIRFEAKVEQALNRIHPLLSGVINKLPLREFRPPGYLGDDRGAKARLERFRHTAIEFSQTRLRNPASA